MASFHLRKYTLLFRGGCCPEQKAAVGHLVCGRMSRGCSPTFSRTVRSVGGYVCGWRVGRGCSGPRPGFLRGLSLWFLKCRTYAKIAETSTLSPSIFNYQDGVCMECWWGRIREDRCVCMCKSITVRMCERGCERMWAGVCGGRGVLVGGFRL